MKKEALSNNALLEAILSGDMVRRNLAFQQLYEDHILQGKARSMSSNLGINEADFPDLIQEAFLALNNQIIEKKYRGDSSIRTYLLSIIYNKMLDHTKKKEVVMKKDGLLIDEPLIELSETEQDDLEQKRNAILKSVLDKLKEDCRQFLINQYYSGMTMAQIVTAMEISNVNQAKKKADSCRKHLRKLIQAEPGLEIFLKQAL